MASTADTLNEFAASLLTRCLDLLADAGIAPPRNQLVSPGLPAYDCDTLAIEVTGLGWELTSPSAQPELGRRMVVTGGQYLAAYQIAIVRCVATIDSKGRAPSDDTITADSRATNRDVWVLWNGLYHALRGKDTDPLFEGPCSKLYLDDAVPVDPSGGVAGWLINLRAQIDGIPAVPGS